MRKVIALILVLGLGRSSCWASGPDQKHIEKIKKQVADSIDRGTRVSIETYDRRKLQGTISQAGTETFTMFFEGQSTTLNYADVKKLKSPMDSHLKAALIGWLVLGGLLGLTALDR
jgi:hypothetical protein